jgi:tRNA dimethylallyltransferase
MKPKLIAIVGPTASGKSSLGIFLAQKIHGEVISADSRQVYKGLDIGTGKVTEHEMEGVPHYLLDVGNPRTQFTADDFVQLGEKAISHILENKRIPIVVGGTGFYVDSLLGRMQYPNVPPNPTLRKKLEKMSVQQLFAMVQKLDPRRAQNIETQNPRRLVRAIEIAKALGKSPAGGPTFVPDSKYDVSWIGLSPSPEKLKENIHIRLAQRIGAGMIKEAQKLYKAGLSYKRMNELGLEYRYLALLLQNKITKEEFVEQLERAINHYAKRQLRWFKRNKDIVWLKNKTEALKSAKGFIKAKP